MIANMLSDHWHQLLLYKLGCTLTLMDITQLIIWAMRSWLSGVLTAAAGMIAHCKLFIETPGPHFPDLL